MARSLLFWVVAIAAFAAVDVAAYYLYRHLVSRGVIASLSEATGARAGLSAPPRTATAVAPVILESAAEPSTAKAVHLSHGQECIGGTIVIRSRMSDGSQGAFQLLEFGEPVRCDGDHRL